MKKWFLTSFTFAVMLFIISGCGNKEIEPRAIDEKNDKCVQCNMAVADDQFATQLVTEKGQIFTFDDIGCMFQWKEQNQNEKIAAEFVRDYETLEWIKLDEAFYVYHKEIYTPMAYNVVSFATEENAKKFAAEYGAEMMKGTEINEHSWGMSEEGMEGHSHE
ncbi:nitrous oxide reductase accessory protein NosL [Bacillus benzoevorans]|uniref:Copper chaperone NosL n=1 Tax=Bacillus benzoevorans TaxID=1456 RepID=A0A7X0HUX2_9BACI|nr:nitrous oxide reductase accessory protein NosL [Bacillus benzoevorans]MBB6447337.1 copper chaperone NosL [Bacillus benzoevorans]